MTTFTRTVLIICDPHLNLDDPIGRCSLDLAASAQFPVTSSTAHTHMNIWASRLAHADTPVGARQPRNDGDVTALLVEDEISDEPTPDQIQEALEARVRPAADEASESTPILAFHEVECGDC